MKELFIKIICIILSFSLLMTQSLNAIAGKNVAVNPNLEESVFVLDEPALEAAMADFKDLESFLQSNPNASYHDLIVSDSEVIVKFDNAAVLMVMSDQIQKSKPPLGIPSFLWGCVFSWAGLLVVYALCDGNKIETKKAFWGCLVNGVIIGILYLPQFAEFGKKN